MLNLRWLTRWFRRRRPTVTVALKFDGAPDARLVFERRAYPRPQHVIERPAVLIGASVLQGDKLTELTLPEAPAVMYPGDVVAFVFDPQPIVLHVSKKGISHAATT